jgi:phosphatidate cytidylyltransferase
MLRQRIVTALILAPLALIAILFLPIFEFQIAIAGVVAIGAYEWAKMSGLDSRAYKAAYTVVALAICLICIQVIDQNLIWYQGQLNALYRYILSASAVWWVFSFAMIIAYPRFSAFWKHSVMIRALFGLMTLIPTWIGVVSLRTSLYEVDPFYGASLIFYVLGIVWAADIGAFFCRYKVW